MSGEAHNSLSTLHCTKPRRVAMQAALLAIIFSNTVAASAWDPCGYPSWAVRGWSYNIKADGPYGCVEKQDTTAWAMMNA